MQNSPNPDKEGRKNQIGKLGRSVRTHLVTLAYEFYGRHDARDYPEIVIDNQEAVTQFAERFSLNIVPERIKLSRIKPYHCPCVLLCGGNSALLVSNAREGRFLLVAEGGAKLTVGKKEIKAFYGGTLLRVLSADQPIGESENEDDHFLPAHVPVDRRNKGRRASDKPTKEGLQIIARDIIGRHKSLLAQLALVSLLSHIMMITVPIFIMSVYDRVVPHLAMETLWALFLGVSIALVLDFCLRILRGYLSNAISLISASDAQTRLFNRLLRMRMQDVPRSPGGLTQSLHDVDSVYQTLPNIVVALLVDIPFFFVVIMILGYIAGSVAWVPVATALLLVVFNVFMARRSRANNELLSKLSSERCNLLAEPISMIETIRATCSEGRFMARWKMLLDRHAMALHKARIIGNSSSVITLVASNVTIVVVLLVGVYGIHSESVSVGALVAATMLSGRAIAPLGQHVALLGRLTTIPATMATVSRIENAILESGGDSRGGPVENIRGALSFSDVSFSYPDAARPALSGINLSISPGQHIGIVGRVGCGKTSLLQLIMRFFEPSDGTLLLDEYNINQFDPRYLRRHLSYLSQTPELFDGSIYDNLHTDIEELDRERLDAVASATGLRNIVAANEEGYGMRVGPRGIFLSGGERQTVALARTLLRKAEIFLLDEPTAAMDSKLEAQIVADIVPLIAGKTVILATHRPPLLQLVDTIVVMEKGNIIAQGPRDEILRKLTGDNEQKTTNVS